MSRRPLFPLVLLPLLAVGTARAADDHEDTWGISTIQVEAATYTLRARRLDAKISFGPADLYVYRVHRNGRFLHSEELEGGGRFVGCRYRHEAGGPVVGRPFPDERDPMGWMLVSGAICGNTHSKRICLITVRERRRYYREPQTYGETRFTSKGLPVFRRTEEGVEVWGAVQEWGGTGTWGSFFVPFCLRVEPDGDVVRVPLPPDIDAWPEDLDGRGGLGAYIAGLREQSPALMRAAIDTMSWDREYAAYLGEHDLPTTLEGLEDLVLAVEGLVAARREVGRQAGEYFGD